MREFLALRVMLTRIFTLQTHKTQQNRRGIPPAQSALMKPCAGFPEKSAFATTDLLVTSIGLMLLAMFAFPCTTSCKSRAMRIPCIANQKMIGLAFRNITVNGEEVMPGMTFIINPDSAGWSRSIHKEQGNIGLADGSAAQVNTTAFQRQLQSTGIVTNRFAVP